MNTKLYKLLHSYQYLSHPKIKDDVLNDNLEKYQKLQNHLILEKEHKLIKKEFFLSIILRTQGLRISMLEELLLGLASQNNQSFELIIVAHKTSDDIYHLIQECVNNLPSWLFNKTRILKCNEGNRTTPINVGFKNAKGEYAAIIDDDDIVYENWVDNFYQLRINHYGKLLHQYVLEQKWWVIKQDNEEALRSIKEPTIKFCCPFRINSELVSNECPLMSMAFPLFFYQELGYQFDESLSTYEDWDYILSLAFLAGVVDCLTPGAVYRHFENTANSLTLHSKKEWNKNYSYILKKSKRKPILYQFKQKKKKVSLRKPSILINDNIDLKSNHIKLQNDKILITNLYNNQIKKISFKFKNRPCYINDLSISIYDQNNQLVNSDKYEITTSGIKDINGNVCFYKKTFTINLILKEDISLLKIILTIPTYKLYSNKDYHIGLRKVSPFRALKRKIINLIRKILSKWH